MQSLSWARQASYRVRKIWIISQPSKTKVNKLMKIPFLGSIQTKLLLKWCKERNQPVSLQIIKSFKASREWIILQRWMKICNMSIKRFWMLQSHLHLEEKHLWQRGWNCKESNRHCTHNHKLSTKIDSSTSRASTTHKLQRQNHSLQIMICSQAAIEAIPTTSTISTKCSELQLRFKSARSSAQKTSSVV